MNGVPGVDTGQCIVLCPVCIQGEPPFLDPWIGLRLINTVIQELPRCSTQYSNFNTIFEFLWKFAPECIFCKTVLIIFATTKFWFEIQQHLHFKMWSIAILELWQIAMPFGRVLEGWLNREGWLHSKTLNSLCYTVKNGAALRGKPFDFHMVW